MSRVAIFIFHFIFFFSSPVFLWFVSSAKIVNLDKTSVLCPNKKRNKKVPKELHEKKGNWAFITLRLVRAGVFTFLIECRFTVKLTGPTFWKWKLDWRKGMLIKSTSSKQSANYQSFSHHRFDRYKLFDSANDYFTISMFHNHSLLDALTPRIKTPLECRIVPRKFCPFPTVAVVGSAFQGFLTASYRFIRRTKWELRSLRAAMFISLWNQLPRANTSNMVREKTDKFAC